MAGNFIYADPVPGQQAVQYATLKLQEQAQHQQALRDIAQQGIAQQNAAAQRAMTQAQMNQQSSELEKNRKARAVEVDKVLASKQLTGGYEESLNKEVEAYNALAAEIGSEDPPTDSEFEAKSLKISPDRKLRLKTSLMNQRKTLVNLATRIQEAADYWNGAFAEARAKGVGGNTELKALEAQFRQDPTRTSLSRDPKTGAFKPVFFGPRMDQNLGPVGMGIGTIPSQVTPIEDLLGGMNTRSTGPIDYQVPAASRLLSVEPMPAPGNVPNPYAFPVPQY